VRLTEVQQAPSGCHLTLNGVRIPDDVLAARGKMQRSKGAAAAGKDEPDSCVGATFMLQQAGMNTRELPSIDLRS
jgi:hypothetical protein